MCVEQTGAGSRLFGLPFQAHQGSVQERSTAESDSWDCTGCHPLLVLRSYPGGRAGLGDVGEDGRLCPPAPRQWASPPPPTVLSHVTRARATQSLHLEIDIIVPLSSESKGWNNTIRFDKFPTMTSAWTFHLEMCTILQETMLEGEDEPLLQSWAAVLVRILCCFDRMGWPWARLDKILFLVWNDIIMEALLASSSHEENDIFSERLFFPLGESVYCDVISLWPKGCSFQPEFPSYTSLEDTLKRR